MKIYNSHGNEITSAVCNYQGNTVYKGYNARGEVCYTATKLKVMTYNCGSWYNGTAQPVPTAQKSEYYNLQNGMLSRANADVLMIQEYLKTFCTDGELAEDLLEQYFDDIHTTNENSGYKGHVTASKNYPISNYATHAFSNSAGTNYPGYETSTITVDGKTINLINTHNQYVTAPQAIHMAEVIEAIEDMEYFILCGDFNINMQTEDKTNVQYIQSVKALLDKSYNMANFNDERGWLKTYYGTSEPTGGKFTDNIVTSSNIEIVEAHIDTAKLTDSIGDKIDHIPLIATLAIY